MTKGEIGGNMWKSQEKSGEQKYKISEVWETAKKVFQKNLKKVLTNERSCSIIAKHLRETSGSESLESEEIGPWKLNNDEIKRNPIRFKRVLSVLVSKRYKQWLRTSVRESKSSWND